MYSMRHLVLLAIIIMFLVAGCGTALTEPVEAVLNVTEEASGTEDVTSSTEEASATEDLSPTEEANETEDPSATEEVLDANGLPPVNLDQPLPPSNASNTLRIAPHGIDTDAGLLTDEGDTRQDVIVEISLSNTTGETIEVRQEDWKLIGEDGVRYDAQPLPDNVQPQLYDQTFESGGGTIAAALFYLPQGIRPALVEWCPLGECSGQPLQVNVDVLLAPNS